MEVFVTKVADYLVSQSWQVIVLFVLVAATCWALRKCSAHWRYLLWLIVLAKCLVPGMISVPLAVLPHEEKSPAKAAVSSPVPVVPASPALKPVPVKATAVKPERAPEDLRTAFDAASPISASPPVATSPSMESSRIMDLSWRNWIALIWFAGVLLFVGYLVVRAWSIQRRLIRSRQTVDEPTQTKVAALAERLGLKVTPRIYMVNGIAQPFVWGWLRGSIYLPMQFLSTATAEQQQAILTHELAHVTRCDAAINLLQILVQAVFFFHPLVWWTNRQIRREREKCCDEFVLASSVANPKQYSQAIVGALVAEYEASQPIPSLAIAGRLKNIEERIQAILSPNRRFYRRPTWAAIVTAVCLIACGMPTAFFLRARADSSRPKTAESPQSRPPSATKTDEATNSQNGLIDMEHWKPGHVLDFCVINAKTKEPLSDVKLLIMFSAQEKELTEK